MRYFWIVLVSFLLGLFVMFERLTHFAYRSPMIKRAIEDTFDAKIQEKVYGNVTPIRMNRGYGYGYDRPSYRGGVGGR